MSVILPAARRQGFEPDCVLCADDIEVGRPAPWMCFENARRMDIHTVAAIVKVDDTPVGIEAGRNAGKWTVGVAKSGNLVECSWEQVQQVEVAELRRCVEVAEETVFAVGAHYVVDTVAELPCVLDDLQARFAAGDEPQHRRGGNDCGSAKILCCRGQRRKDVVVRALSLRISMCFLALFPGGHCLARRPSIASVTFFGILPGIY